MHKECECRFLEVNVSEFIKMIEKCGAKRIGNYFQRRYVYDFNPVVNSKWIRLRNDGKKTTLTIKNIRDRNLIDGTDELEIEVSDFIQTNLMLNELGYIPRNYQENKRITYVLDEIEIDIDIWPLIPPYVELEGKNKEAVTAIINKLKLDRKKITNYDVTSIYQEIYNIDILKIKDLRF